MRVAERKLLANLFVLTAFLVSMACWAIPVQAQTLTPGTPVYIYLFWGDGCSHCAKAKPYLESLPTKYPSVVFTEFEVYYNEDNQELFSNMAGVYGLEYLAVPTIFIGPYYLQGYSEELNEDIETTVAYCLQNGCADAIELMYNAAIEITPAATIPPESTYTTSPITETPLFEPQLTATPNIISTPVPVETVNEDTETPESIKQDNFLDIPLLGNVDLELQSITLSTVLIAFVDGFNPCSLWVLSILLALTLHTGSRKKVFAIGLIFLTVTAAIYALFIAGLFSVLKIASFLGWIQILVALIALFFALVNIKDYFWYKEGISFTIAEDKKSGIFNRIRAVINASQSLWGLISATVMLAAGVSLVEFSCTAGFPVLWTNLLTAQNVSGATFVLLLLLYMLIYQLDELIIFSSAVISLKASRLEEKHGRLLKLISGMLMLTLSVVMFVDPALLNDLGSSLIVLGLSFLATLIVLIIHQVLLPKFGIQIGSKSEEKVKHRGNISK